MGGLRGISAGETAARSQQYFLLRPQLQLCFFTVLATAGRVTDQGVIVDRISISGANDSLELLAAARQLDIYKEFDTTKLPSFTGLWWPNETPPSPEPGRQELATDSLSGPTLQFGRGGNTLDYADTQLDSQPATLPGDQGLTQQFEATSLASDFIGFREAERELLADLEAAGFQNTIRVEESEPDCT